MIHRRTILAAASAATTALLVSLSSGMAQQAPALPRIAFVAIAAPDDFRVQAFRLGLHEFGYVEGETILIEYFYFDQFDQLVEVVPRVVASRPDIIMAVGTATVLALKQATTTIPIVFANIADPVASGIVESLPRPGGNATGTVINAADYVGKSLQMLSEMVPGLARAAVFHNPNNPQSGGPQVVEALAVARALDIGVVLVGADGSDNWDELLSSLDDDVRAVLFVAETTYTNNAARIVESLQRYALPATFTGRQFVEIGGLMSYGPRIGWSNARAAYYVDRILRGVPPGDLAVEQPWEYDLIINGRTADALGLTIPPTLLLLATEIIE